MQLCDFMQLRERLHNAWGDTKTKRSASQSNGKRGIPPGNNSLRPNQGGGDNCVELGEKSEKVHKQERGRRKTV